MSISPPVRIGLIGCGGIVKKAHLPSLLRLSADAQIVAIADPVTASRDSIGVAAGVGPAGRYDGFPALLEGAAPDLVLVATPHHLHLSAVVAAARAGIAVVCEKPLAATLAEARELVETIEAAGIAFSVVHNFLFSPGNAAARRLLDGHRNGELPRFSRAQSLFAKEEPLDPLVWRNRVETGGGALNDTCYHELYQVEALVGSPIVRVQARVNTVHHALPVDDLVLLALEHANGILSTVLTSWAVPGFEGTFCELHTNRRTIRVEGRGRRLRVYARDARTWEQIAIGPTDGPGVASGHFGFWQASLQAFRAGRPLPVPPRHALRQVSLLEAARESSRRRGEAVDVQLEL